MKITALALLMFLWVGCTSDPYIVHTLIDKDKNEKVERICTHKTAVIPWYAVYAAGIFTWRYGQECQIVKSPMSPRPAMATTNQQNTSPETAKTEAKK